MTPPGPLNTTFLQVVGSRRSIRWFKSWQPVERSKVQRILETARMTASPGNLQPWRAIVVDVGELDAADRECLLNANNRQGHQLLAPIWIYWYADPSAAVPSAFLESVRTLLGLDALPAVFGWSEEAARAAIEEGAPVPVGMPALDLAVHELPAETSVLIAAQEASAAIKLATLAAVNEGLGTCLITIAAPNRHDAVRSVLDVPPHFVPIWLQLVGYPSEGWEAGGQRPRAAFETLFASRRWGTPFARDSEVVEELRREGLLQPSAPLPGRDEEVRRLTQMFADLYPANPG